MAGSNITTPTARATAVAPVRTEGDQASLSQDLGGNLRVTGGGTTGSPSVVVGNVAAGAADSGAPVKVGGKNNTTLPTYADGQRGDLQIGTRGSLNVTLFAPNSTSGLQVATPADTTGLATQLMTYSLPALYNGASLDRGRAINGALAAGTGTAAVAIAPTSASAAGITPVVSTAAEATRVLKASAGNLYSVYAVNLTATAGFLLILNTTSAPADGAVTPLDAVALPANGVASISYNSGPPAAYSTGITAVLSSAATVFTKTTGVITGFIKGAVV